jgi:uncharacterized membrane protein YgcG
VTDLSGSLDGRTSDIETALTRLLDQHDVQLFVLFVETTQDLTATDYATQTAHANSLGANDALLMVAVGDHTDAIWVSDSLASISTAELDQIIADTLEPGLRSGDYPGAVIDTADALGTAAASNAPAETPTASAAPSGTGAGQLDVGSILGLVLLVVGLVLVIGWLLARRASGAGGAQERRRAAGLAQQANAQLIATDERVRNADQEAGFAEAEFGTDEAAPFHAAIAQARDELRAAFGIRQKLDDAEPEDPPTRESMLNDILGHCQKANAALDEQAKRIAELRNLEQNAPTVLAGLPDQIATQEARLPTAERTMQTLRGYAESTWSPVKGNVEEARKGLAGSRDAVTKGQASLAAKDLPGAVHALHTAQAGVAGATALLDAIDKLAATAQDAATQVAAELTAADTDLAAARTAATPLGATHAAQLSAAKDSLDAAHAAAAAKPLDPVEAHRLAAAAHASADQVLAAARQDAEQATRFAAALDASLVSAKNAVTRASDFVATRRHGVGGQARTRLTEAESSLDRANGLRQTDPKSAMDAARRAEQLANEAYGLASDDFGAAETGTRPGAGSDLGGAILGGIIGGILAGGGRRGGWGGGWGGSPWGSAGPFGGRGGWGGGRGGGFGGFGGGGFGGGGRSAGGSWGGGGGRAAGGRW